MESARRIAAYVQRTGAHAPLLSLVADVFEGKVDGAKALATLMERQVGEE